MTTAIYQTSRLRLLRGKKHEIARDVLLMITPVEVAQASGLVAVGAALMKVIGYFLGIGKRASTNDIDRAKLMDEREEAMNKRFMAEIARLDSELDTIRKALSDETEKRKLAEIGAEVEHMRADASERALADLKLRHEGLVVELDTLRTAAIQREDLIQQLQGKITTLKEEIAALETWADHCRASGYVDGCPPPPPTQTVNITVESPTP